MGRKQKVINSELTKKCSIVVSSYDGFEDVWEAFFTLFFRYWSDCPFDVYLITNEKNFDHEKVEVIKVGKDKGWASNLKVVLKKIKTPYVLYMQEDYFLKEKINTKKVIRFLSFMKREKADCMRLIPVPGADKKWKQYKRIGLISKNIDYRISLQAAFWKKRSLERVLHEGETGWDMETKGSKDGRTEEMLFLSVIRDKNKRPPLPYLCTAIVKGRWKKRAIELCKKEKIEIDWEKRGIYKKTGAFDILVYKIKKIVRVFFALIQKRSKLN